MKKAFAIHGTLIVLAGVVMTFQACGPSFQAGQLAALSSASESPPQDSVSGVELYSKNCANCHGSLANSTKIGRSQQTILNALSVISPMASLKLTPAEINLIAQALQVPPVNASQFTCKDKSVISSSPTLRLTSSQYKNSLNALFGTAAVGKISDLVSLLPSDKVKDVGDFQRQYAQVHIDAFYQIAQALAIQSSQDMTMLTSIGGSCLSLSTVTESCFETFIKSFGLKVFRRPLLVAEVNQLKSLYTNLGRNRAGVAASLQFLLMSPQFLYRAENGTTIVGKRMKLTTYEIASRLSFMMIDSMPDNELLAAAGDGTLASQKGMREQVNRLLLLPAAKVKLAGLADFWMKTEEQDLDGIPNYLKNGVNTAGLWTEMNREMGEFFASTILNDKGSFRDLMTSQIGYARSPALASIYGQSSAVSDKPLPVAAGRKGLLSRGPFLASSDGGSRPILRGAHLRRYIMCQPIPSPEGDVASQGPDVSTEAMIQMHSGRERTALKTSSATCMNCHSLINPAGFVFEKFDGLGRIRAVETNYRSNGTIVSTHAIDSSSQFTMGGSTFSLADSAEFSQMWADRPEGGACLIRNVYRYYKMQNEQSSDECVLDSMLKSSQGNQGPLDEAIRSLFLDPSFTEREVDI